MVAARHRVHVMQRCSSRLIPMKPRSRDGVDPALVAFLRRVPDSGRIHVQLSKPRRWQDDYWVSLIVGEHCVLKVACDSHYTIVVQEWTQFRKLIAM